MMLKMKKSEFRTLSNQVRTPIDFLQVNFSENGNKNHYQTHIRKFEILEISPWNQCDFTDIV